MRIIKVAGWRPGEIQYRGIVGRRVKGDNASLWYNEGMSGIDNRLEVNDHRILEWIGGTSHCISHNKGNRIISGLAITLHRVSSRRSCAIAKAPAPVLQCAAGSIAIVIKNIITALAKCVPCYVE